MKWLEWTIGIKEWIFEIKVKEILNMSRIDDRIIDLLNSKREQLEYIKLREECLNSFDRFLDFVNVEDKDGIILKYRDYLNRFEQSGK